MTVIGLASGLTVPQINATVTEPWGYTQINVVKLNYVWTIINFSFLPREYGQSVLSPTFSDGDDGNEWQLELFPRSSSDSNDLTLGLNLLSSKQTILTAKIKLSILNAKNEKIAHINKATFTFRKEPYEMRYQKFLPRNFLLDDINEHILNDELRILCELNATRDILVTSGPSDKIKFNVTQRHLPNDLELLWESGKFTDVTLVAGEIVFQAHTAILAARSSVFSAWFEDHPNRDQFELIPMKKNVFKEMLRFIYKDTVENLNDLAVDLLLVANNYNLEKLKIMCMESLFKNLSIENAVSTFITADAGNANQLRKKVLNFIITHAVAVMDTPSFTSMTQSHPLLTAEILRPILMIARMDKETSNVLQ